MIRLAVFGADGQVCNEIDRRLHGSISLLSADAISVGTPLAAVDASVFVGSRTPDPDEMLQIVSDGKPVLLANDTVFAMEGLDATLDRESSESRIAVMNPDRWLPSRRLISDELKGTKLGPVGLIRSHRWEASGSGGVIDSNGLPPGLLRDLDLVVWLKQALPNLIFATQAGISESSHGPAACDKRGLTLSGHAVFEAISMPSKESDPFCHRLPGPIQVHLGFGDGTMALVGYSGALPDKQGYQSLSVICANGAISADDHSNRQLVFCAGAAQADPSDEGILSVVSLIQQFVDGLSSAHDFEAGVMAWRQVRTLAKHVRRSLDSRQAVSWEEH